MLNHDEKKEPQKEKSKEWAKKNKEYFKEYRKKNAKKMMANTIKWMNKYPERSVIVRTRCRAKRLKIDFNIDESDIVIPTKCPVLGIPINPTYGTSSKTGPKPDSFSIDRIDNNKGYIKGNICIISNKANIMKSSASPEELLQFAFWVILKYGHLIDKSS